RLEGDRAEVAVAGKRVRCRADELVALGAAAAPPSPAPAPVEPAEADVAAAELLLIGHRVEAALDELDVYLDHAVRAGRGEVRVVHGHGTGRLREAVRQHLRSHPAVASFRAGAPNEGGNGATVVALRE
ncbi:MAG TPA: Smr/MutS family protein, partial [Thermoanaerobaculia bacterium]|nr:Smr/MutS family protein [Thermoanaerobaculia bacterium]